MTSLYDQNPAAWDKLAAGGKPSLRDMARRFETCADMDRALGTDGAAPKWLRGVNGATSRSERLAREWLEAHRAKPAAPVTPPPAEAVTFLVIAAPATADRAQKVLALLGCEFVEV